MEVVSTQKKALLHKTHCEGDNRDDIKESASDYTLKDG